MNGMTSMRVVYTLSILSVCLATAFCGVHPDGVSKVSREQDVLGNYQFSYSVSNAEGEQFRKEGTDLLGRVVGSYGLTHADGSHRVVDYVADKDGFRAQVRSNEPGVAISDSADAPIIPAHPGQPLLVAASSQEDSGRDFGSRLKTEIPRVAYVERAEEKPKLQEGIDNAARESRQRNFDDYRPRSPVAYYPSDSSGSPRPLPAPARLSDTTSSGSRLGVHSPSAESKPLDVYFPPIDPHTAIRRPAYYLPRSSQIDDSYFSTTSRKPYIPPYGGFDDDPLPVDRRPGISMTTIHGGLGSDRFQPPQTSTPAYGAGRYPSDDTGIPRNFLRPRFPPSSGFPSVSRLPGSLLPSPPQSEHQGVLFNPPAYNGGFGSPPNFVLRAVPIPNGIQAVRVDPNTGQIYERLVYPLFLRPDGHPAYDRNILLHNDDVSDDDAIRNDNPGYFDIPFRRSPPFRSARNQPFDENDDFDDRMRLYNRSYVVDEKSLSKPTAKDFEWVQKQLALVEGFDRNRYPDRMFVNNHRFGNSEFPEFDDFDETAEAPRRENSGPLSQERISSLLRPDDTYSRNPRHSENLTPSDSGVVKVEERPTSSETESKAVEDGKV